jgi:hypothetical protein
MPDIPGFMLQANCSLIHPLSIGSTGPSDRHLGFEVLSQDPEDEAQIWTCWPWGNQGKSDRLMVL